MIACYTLCAVAIARIPSAQMLSRFMFAGACCVAVCLFVSFYWKISLHMTALGAAVAFIVLINIASGGGLFAAFIAALLAAGALGSARLKLGYHTLSQVAVGFATGFIVAAGVGLFGLSPKNKAVCGCSCSWRSLSDAAKSFTIVNSCRSYPQMPCLASILTFLIQGLCLKFSFRHSPVLILRVAIFSTVRPA